MSPAEYFNLFFMSVSGPLGSTTLGSTKDGGQRENPLAITLIKGKQFFNETGMIQISLGLSGALSGALLDER